MEEHYQEGDNQGIRRWITKLKIKFDSEPKDGKKKKNRDKSKCRRS